MPTDIYFAAGTVLIKVEEDPSEVAEAFASAAGLPFRLTDQSDQSEVYINPGAVAFWSDSAVSPALEAQESPQPTAEQAQESPQPAAQRGGVTDLWGNPLGKKKRRR